MTDIEALSERGEVAARLTRRVAHLGANAVQCFAKGPPAQDSLEGLPDAQIGTTHWTFRRFVAQEIGLLEACQKLATVGEAVDELRRRVANALGQRETQRHVMALPLPDRVSADLDQRDASSS
ncbi:MAG: hypothetical protein U0174_13875 [Polyangiaceae bacterium]